MAVALGGLSGRSYNPGCRENLHSSAQWISRHLVSMVSPAESKKVTVYLEKRTFQYASQKGSVSTSELLKLVTGDPRSDYWAGGWVESYI